MEALREIELQPTDPYRPIKASTISKPALLTTLPSLGYCWMNCYWVIGYIVKGERGGVDDETSENISRVLFIVIGLIIIFSR